MATRTTPFFIFGSIHFKHDCSIVNDVLLISKYDNPNCFINGTYFYLKETTLDNWSMSLGKLLLCVKEKAVDDFDITISSIRSKQTQYLISASLESGGYQRAYNSIIRYVG